MSFGSGAGSVLHQTVASRLLSQEVLLEDATITLRYEQTIDDYGAPQQVPLRELRVRVITQPLTGQRRDDTDPEAGVFEQSARRFLVRGSDAQAVRAGVSDGDLIAYQGETFLIIQAAHYGSFSVLGCEVQTENQ